MKQQILGKLLTLWEKRTDLSFTELVDTVLALKPGEDITDYDDDYLLERLEAHIDAFEHTQYGM